jgi:hypothetical protein
MKFIKKQLLSNTNIFGNLWINKIIIYTPQGLVIAG